MLINFVEGRVHDFSCEWKYSNVQRTYDFDIR